ncbi:MAG: LL-diaminopimelate aminotransferase [Bacillota bacterium]
MQFPEAQRIKNLPPYLFTRIERLIAQKKAEGVDVISLGIGDPDLPTPEHIVEEMAREVRDPVNHQYPTSEGLPEYRQAVARWHKRRFGIELDPRTEVLTLIGSKDGIAHLPWCCLDPGDTVLVPDPGYPVYAGSSILAGAVPYYVRLLPEKGFLPDFADIPTEAAKKAKLMFLNYPNNPTGAVAEESFFAEAVAFAKEFAVLIAHDAAYSEVAYEGYRPPSFLQVPGAKEVAIEFGSLSKTFNMTGWRIGWAVGNAGAVEALGRLKSNVDSGQFNAVQKAAIAGLDGPLDNLREVNEIYRQRRDMLVDGLNSLGWRLEKPKATFYVWAPVPAGYTSASFAEAVLEKAAVVITPGTGYGAGGEGYFRLSLTVPTARLQEALERIRRNIGPVTF